MTNPCIICVAITGSLPTKDNNPAVPITIAEQVESTQEAFEAAENFVIVGDGETRHLTREAMAKEIDKAWEKKGAGQPAEEEE